MNNYGYYAQSYLDVVMAGSPTPVPTAFYMHPGCDKFLRGVFNNNALAGILLNDFSGQFGQFIIDGTTIESNPGFGIFIDVEGYVLTASPPKVYPGLPAPPISIRDVWFENNGYSQDITIERIKEYPDLAPPSGGVFNTVVSDTFLGGVGDIYCRGVETLNIYNGSITHLQAVNSTVSMYGSVSGIVAMDDDSSVVAYDHRYRIPISEDIFVQSFSYDATWATVKSSVWGPLRTHIAAGLKNVLMSSGLLQAPVTEIWRGYGSSPDGYATDIVDAGTMINYADTLYNPLLNITCKEMALSPGNIVQSNESFSVAGGGQPLYYFWSIHAYKCGEGDITGYFGSEPNGSSAYLGQVIFKKDQWACAYGLKKIDLESDTIFKLWFMVDPTGTGGTIRFCHYQVLAFEKLSDGISYMNSKTFAYRGQTCGGD